MSDDYRDLCLSTVVFLYRLSGVFYSTPSALRKALSRCEYRYLLYDSSYFSYAFSPPLLFAYFAALSHLTREKSSRVQKLARIKIIIFYLFQCYKLATCSDNHHKQQQLHTGDADVSARPSGSSLTRPSSYSTFSCSTRRSSITNSTWWPK